MLYWTRIEMLPRKFEEILGLTSNHSSSAHHRDPSDLNLIGQCGQRLGR